MIFHILSALKVRSLKLLSLGEFHAYGLLTTFLVWFPANVNIFVKGAPSCSGASVVWMLAGVSFSVFCEVAGSVKEKKFRLL